FEVVEERPDAVAAEIDAAAHRLAGGEKMGAEVIHAEWILDDSEGHRRIVEGSAVLRDVDRDVSVSIAGPRENVGEPLREDFPIDGGIDRAFAILNADRPLDDHVRIEFCDAALVVIDADEIDRLPDHREVSLRKIWPRFAVHRRKLGRIRAEENRIEILP